VSSPDRPYDVVLFGATGYAGGLTADYLAAHGGDGLRWALAGRSMEKLRATRERLGVDVELLRADVEDLDSVRDVAESASVAITTVGPYVLHGEPLLAACAEAGTDYVDLTGEPEFVDEMWLRYHARAVETGARLVHCCGFDSIPHDLGAQFTVEHLPEGVPLRVEGFVSAGGSFSGGTYQSAVLAFSRVRKTAAAAARRRRREERPVDRRVRSVKPRPRRESLVDGWAVPMPTIDPQVVTRSARALPRYGPDFSYAHFVAVKRLAVAVGGAAGIASLATLAQLPPARDLLLKFRASGAGPSEEQREKGWFRVRFRGRGGGREVVCDVEGGDPGYGDTAKMLAESGLCLAQDALPETAGQVTTAQAMGPALRERLERAGIAFSLVQTTG